MQGFVRSETHPKISFVVPCYNRLRYLDLCLRSIAHCAPTLSEIIVVDDGSTEDVKAVVEKYRPQARYIRQVNQGASAARNTGIRESGGEYVRFVDSDDYLLNAAGLTQQVDILDHDEKVGMVFGAALRVDARGRQFGLRLHPHLTANAVRSGDDEIADLLFGNYITTSSTMVRRSMFDLAGVFRTEFSISEDWELWLRMVRSSWIGYVSTPVVAYRVHGDSLIGGGSLEVWIRNHLQILDGLYADPVMSQKLAPLRGAAYSTVYAKAARTYCREGRPRRAWHYGKQAVADGGWPILGGLLRGCGRQLLVGRVPPSVRLRLRRRHF